MTSRLLAFSALACSLVVLTATASEPEAVNAHSHLSPASACAAVCGDCHLQCEMCYLHCSSLLHDGKQGHARCMQLCLDCAECCALCSSLCARQSEMSGPTAAFCADCCETCATACDKYPDDEHMAACAACCRACAQECRSLAQSIQ